MTSTTFVPFHQLDREWDARFNVPTTDDLEHLLACVKSEVQSSKLRYTLVSGLEIGDRPYNNDYLIQHVHVCLVYANRVSKSAILKNLGIKQGNGYYLVPRNRTLPYSGWKKHHSKKETKVNSDSLILYEYGDLPCDRGATGENIVKRSENEKKRKLDDIIVEMKDLIDAGDDAEAFRKFPRNYLTYGEKLKAMTGQKRDFFQHNGDPHLWLMGLPGTGKSALLTIVYPNYFNKNMDTRFFDKYDNNIHSHVLCQDVDHNVMEKLGVQFFKSICDEAGYPIDQKYKTPQICRLVVLVSSNFNIHDVLPEDLKGRNENLTALRRRFFEINIKDLLPVLGLKLLPKYEIQQLKKEGNTDPTKLFMDWDYLRDTPTGEPIKSAEHYQQLVKDKYYGK
uniref:NS1 n=1 Tax=Rhinopithecus-associated parvovirus TaxID=3071140 RepID=A0AA50KAA1_9VIRU|nr:NS1 [Rhinopithecus-associated parvovirus]